MSQTRQLPPKERLIQNEAGLFFKDGWWTAHAEEATVFPTVGQALRARRTFGLEHIQLVSPPEFIRRAPRNN